jgi:hypothetical protein
MFRRSLFALVCVSAACGTVENDSSDANVPPLDGPAGDAPGDGPDSPGSPDAGPGGPLMIGDARHDFQRVTIGASGQPFTTRVSNVSGAALGPLQVSVTGDAAAEFAVSEDGCGTRVLGAGTDCQLTVNFQPTQPGERVARLAVSGGEATVTMDLTGIGLTLGALAITPADGHGYGQVTIGQTSDSHTFMVTNTGESPIARPTISVLDTTNFSIDDNTCVGELAPLGTCNVTASFKPSVGGVSTTSLLAASGQNMAAASLSGTGTGRITVNKTGDGASVSSVTGGGVDCGSTCSATVAQASVALVASVPTNTELTAWSVAACGTDLRCVVPVDRATRTIDVTFRTRYPLSVSRSGSGTGRVAGGDIDCGTTCSALLFAQTTVSLRATPDAGSLFSGWTGCTTATGDTCTVTMSGAGMQAVAARFEAARTLSTSVTGTGSLSSNPGGISCGTDCTESYANGTTVVLTASPGTGQQVTSWGGACGANGTATICSVLMDAAKSVSVTFGPRYRLTVRPSVPNSQITVTPAPAGGSTTCNTTSGCTYTYNGQTSISLFADHPSPLTWVWVGWSGVCSGTSDSCVVTLTQPSTATTNYTPR